MLSQRKMLSSGTAARSRSVSVRPADAGRAVTTAIPGSVAACAEDGVRIEVSVATNEAARHLRQCAGVDDQAEAFARSVGNRDEDRVRSRAGEDALDLSGSAEHEDALEPSPGQLRIVVDEADHLLAWRLA